MQWKVRLRRPGILFSSIGVLLALFGIGSSWEHFVDEVGLQSLVVFTSCSVFLLYCIRCIWLSSRWCRMDDDGISLRTLTGRRYATWNDVVFVGVFRCEPFGEPETALVKICTTTEGVYMEVTLKEYERIGSVHTRKLRTR